MARQMVADKKEKSLGEIVVVVILLSLLMATFIYYFFKQQDQFTHVGFSGIASRFANKITTVHAQWFMDNQPHTVYLATNDGEQIIHVNNNGWVDSKQIDNRCQDIWLQVMDGQTLFMKTPISIVELRNTIDQLKQCRYSLPSGEFFHYNPNNGKVSKVERI